MPKALIEHPLVKPPIATLMLATIGINILGLALPIASQQIFNRVLRNPENATLTILVLLVIGTCMIEAGLKLGRAYLLIEAGRSFVIRHVHTLLRKIVSVSKFEMGSAAASSLEHITSIHKAKDKCSGQLLVARAELMFVPVIIGLIFYISFMNGVLVLIFMVGTAIVTHRDATRLTALADRAYGTVEARYAFLFTVLEALHPLKALGVEQHLLRRYEHVQTDVADASMAAGKLIGRLTNDVIILSHGLTVAVLILGAYSVAVQGMTLGAVSAVLLLAGRLLQPLQRAVFILIQTRDLDKAEDALADVLGAEESGVPADRWLEIENDGRVSLEAVALDDGTHVTPGAGIISFDIAAGETIALTGASEQVLTGLLRVIAGIDHPASGSVRLNGLPVGEYGQAQRNKCVAYLSPDARLFNGTIRDNITRFGEVSVREAFEVAQLMEIDRWIDELPMGIETRVGGGGGIPPGLRQQVALLRALVLRPRLILFDNADRGLDRDSYARLNRFFGRIRGLPTIILVSEDSNLTQGADRHFHLGETGIDVSVDAAHTRTSYRSLKL